VPEFWSLDASNIADTVSWLRSVARGDTIAGYDAAGWEATSWVLHAMYEDPIAESQATHDDLRKQRIAAGLETPAVVDSLNFDDVSTVVGNSIGMTRESPGVDVVRLRWRDLANRLGVDLDGNEFPPCYRWFPYRSWPAAIAPPDEGSLDDASLESLVEVLVQQSSLGPATPCVAHYSSLATGNFDEVWMRGVMLGDLPAVVRAADNLPGSPTNWWPEDRSWFAYTDWDLWGTKVSGPRSLIAAVGAAEVLETFAWSRSDRED
jgi:hypothetical protein